MANEAVQDTFQKVKNKKAKKKTISFDEELVPKHVAEQILIRDEANQLKSKQHKIKKRKKLYKTVNQHDDLNESNKRKILKIEQVDDDQLAKRRKLESKQESKKEKKKKQVKSGESVTEPEKEELGPEAENEQCEKSSTETKKKESIRERKRKRYMKLLEEKKLKTELALQQKSLNYLSKWKHSREEWKFEKLRQIWLQHNMYDSSKIPQEFWDILVDYFSNCKGKARDIILKDALKLIEENTEDEDEMKIQRARNIIQTLQE